MSYVTLMMTAVGVMISSVAGLICYLGQLPGDLTMDWLPFGAELLAHPEASLGLGAWRAQKGSGQFARCLNSHKLLTINRL